MKGYVQYLNCHRLSDELLFTCLLTCEFYHDPYPINQKQGIRYQKRRFYFAMPKKNPTYCRKVSVAYILTDHLLESHLYEYSFITYEWMVL